MKDIATVHLLAFIPTIIIQLVKIVRDFIERKNEITIESNNTVSNSKIA